MDKVLCLVLLLAICYRVSSQGPCIYMVNEATGNLVEGQPEFRCIVVNECDTAMCGIVLKCPGFEPIVAVDSRFLAKGQVDKCLVYQGNAIGSPGQFAFTYALPSGATYDFVYDGGDPCDFRYPPP